LARLAADPALEAEGLALVCFNADFRGEAGEGIEPGREAVAIARRLGDLVVLGDALLSYATAVGDSGMSGAETIFQDGFSVVEQSGDSHTAIHLHNNFGCFLMMAGRTAAARHHFEEAILLGSAGIIGSRSMDVMVYNLGLVLLDNDAKASAEKLREVLRGAKRSGELTLAAYATLGLACCATREGDFARAAVLHGGADNLLALLGSGWQRLEQQYRDRDLADLRSRLPVDFDRLYQSGKSMPRAEIIDDALNRAQGSGPNQ
jgi:hypothetical protein